MKRLYPLTLEEQEFAAIHVDIVDKFLKRERLDPEEYYGIVIFGYLEAVQKQYREPIPEEKQNFDALAKICMKHAVGEDWKYRNKLMRKGTPLSLDYLATGTDDDDDDFSFYDLIPDITQATERQTLDADLVARILAVATPREREAIDLACQGYETREVAEIMGIAGSTASTILCNFRRKAKAVRDDREVIKCPQWERDKEKIQARNRAYQQSHRLELNEKARLRARANPEKARAKSRAYYAAHKEEILKKDRARKAAKRAAEKQAREQEKYRPRCSEHQGRQVAVAV